ncbi:MAG: hypothetical protein KDE24_26955, partial [Caldilinea sp.]|nr:hypothetical protein [Caldilinea sp.]
PVRMENGRFRCFWSLDSGWGEVEVTPSGAELRVLYGQLELRSLALPLAGAAVTSVRLGAEEVTFGQDGNSIRLDERVTVLADAALRVHFD